ncbi:hypothetical protein [Gaiella sp.]|uniref:hypothetical protein n=1 Tax=Gaiella sp. TaxID=2663207 RepID=UPI002D809318|nr:hypothetical protein [Gaiella sp.]
MTRARGERRLRSFAVALVSALVCTGAAWGADVGANDDTGKYEPDAGAAFYDQMASLGLRQTVVTVRWQPSDPLALGERPLLDLTVAAARRAGLGVVFATYPYPPREIESGLASPEAFGAWLAELAGRYPEVRQFVVGNEPNQPAFWRPQFARAKQRSARAFGPFLAAGYDALKAADPNLTVVGVGLSPRGNDRPLARSNVSTSPVRFLAALGAWYRSSGRQLPLMDGLSFHPYPNRATDPLARGYPWPNAGFINLDRVKQALWDAFAGTGQPTTREGLRLYLDEVGWQVDTAAHEGYAGLENVAVTDEGTQAAIYGELVRRAACDPDIAQVNVFGFRDDRARTGFQAGLHRLDGTPRPAADAVRAAVSDGGCAGRSSRPWRPARAVLGARRPGVRVGTDDIAVELKAAEAASARVCLLPGAHTLSSAKRVLAARKPQTGTCASGRVPQNRRTTVRVGRLVGPHTLAVRLSAETNPARATTTVRLVR